MSTRRLWFPAFLNLCLSALVTALLLALVDDGCEWATLVVAVMVGTIRWMLRPSWWIPCTYTTLLPLYYQCAEKDVLFEFRVACLVMVWVDILSACFNVNE